jgi:Mlo family
MAIAELMILGFISLLLVFFQNYISKICIPESVGNTMLPCKHQSKGMGKSGRRLLRADIDDFGSNRRSLAADSSSSNCGKVSVQPFYFYYVIVKKYVRNVVSQSELLLFFSFAFTLCILAFSSQVLCVKQGSFKLYYFRFTI